MCLLFWSWAHIFIEILEDLFWNLKTFGSFLYIPCYSAFIILDSSLNYAHISIYNEGTKGSPCSISLPLRKRNKTLYAEHFMKLLAHKTLKWVRKGANQISGKRWQLGDRKPNPKIERSFECTCASACVRVCVVVLHASFELRLSYMLLYYDIWEGIYYMPYGTK